jgi:hypothetical protein
MKTKPKEYLAVVTAKNLTLEACVAAQPMSNFITAHGSKMICMAIDKEVALLMEVLGITMSASAITTVVKDIVDRYRLDSLEDVLMCIKNGRQGMYGTTYGKFNAIIFSEWMAQHLEAKYALRDRQHENSKKHQHNWNSREEYEAAFKKGEAARKEAQQLKGKQYENERQYNNFKAKLLNKVQVPGGDRQSKDGVRSGEDEQDKQD